MGPLRPPGEIGHRWAASGMMALTGTPARPLGPPERLVPGVDALGRRFADLNPLALLGERAAALGLRRRGAQSCGGAARMVPAADGWLAVSLARPDDVAAVPAWLGLGHPLPGAGGAWAAVTAGCAGRPAGELVDRARLLGLPVAAVGHPPARPGVLRHPVGPAPARPDPRGAVVVDLTSLWAGPLCGALLAGRGATVIKVESTRRPDGARRGPAAFFDLLNGAKRSVAVDLSTAEGVGVLRRLIAAADVVVEASRPRALEQLGVVAAACLAEPRGPQVWISITGHGRTEGDRVGFGDDAAAGGGLVVTDGEGPLFCGDAVADPLAGLAAADAALAALEAGGRWLVDVSMAAVAAELAGATVAVDPALVPARPRLRPAPAVAPPLGADTVAVLDGLRIDR